MANYLDATIALNYREDNTSRMAIPAKKTTLPLTSSIRAQGAQNIGTTYEAIDLASVASDGGPAYFYNRDDENFVEIGLEIAAAFVPVITIPPQTAAYLPGVADKDLFAQADTAAVDLEYVIWEP